MADAKLQANVFNDYDYMKDDSIDPELKCPLCTLPFQSPVASATCGHTFCQVCISQWMTRQATCPICRTMTSAKEFRPISTRIVLNQLERLLVRCKRCNQANIQRGDIHEHEKRCPNQTVSCPAFDIKCKWKGARSALTQHIQECPFQKIRPAIDDIYEHLKNIYEPLVDELQTVRQQLEKQMQRTNDQNHFLLAVFNKGKPMTNQCSGQTWNCQLQPSIQIETRSQRKQKQKNPFQEQLNFQQEEQEFSRPVDQSAKTISPENKFICTNCQCGVNPQDIVLHHCEGGGICRSCLETYGSLESHEKIFANKP
ncbi:unnamed protein product [Rotaria magnacalcarata]